MSVRTLKYRDAVLLSGKYFEYLVGIRCPENSDEKMTEAVIWEVDSFGIHFNILSIFFDYTASNTPLIQGAYTRIEREFRKIFCGWFAVIIHMN